MVTGLAEEGVVEEHAVDGEVAAEDVFAGVGGELDGVGAAAVGVAAVGAEGGDFGGDVVVGDDDDAEVGADGLGAGEELLDERGGGAGGDVEVFGGEAEEEIADAAAGEIGLVAGGGEGLDDGGGGAVLGAGEDGSCGLHGVLALPFYDGEMRLGADGVQAGTLGTGLILGIESSCDETAALTVKDGVAAG